MAPAGSDRGGRKRAVPPARKRRRAAGPPPPARPGPDRMLEIYRYLSLTRLMEDRLSALYRQGKVQGGLYSSRGQEAISVGSALALQPQDILAPAIRDLGAMLVRGFRPLEIFLQYLQREGGPCRGRDTSLHFGRTDRGIVAPISHLGTLVPVLSGVLLAGRMRRIPLVAMTYVGDGTTSTGDFHEGLGFASVQRLPLVILIENNRYAYSTPVSRQTLLEDLADKARAYGIPGGVVDGNDALAVLEAASRAVERARQGEGPVLLECKTMRMKGHSEHDDAWYVPRAELEFWERRDPILLMKRRLLMEGIASEPSLRKLERRLEEEMESDLEKALAAPFPLPESILEDVYASSTAAAPPRQKTSGGRMAGGGRR